MQCFSLKKMKKKKYDKSTQTKQMSFLDNISGFLLTSNANFSLFLI